MHPMFEKFLKVSRVERKAYFSEAATRMQATVESIEKDFWVCLILDVLFNDLKDDKHRLLFKGGTSLSKACRLISRFSEDVDFVVFRQDLGFHEARDPLTNRDMSRKERERLAEELKEAASTYIRETLRDRLCQGLAGLGSSCAVTIDHTDQDQSTLLVGYDTLYPRDASNEYVRPHVKLEGGARSALDPHSPLSISPYIAHDFPQHDWEIGHIPTVSPKRTFLDKIILIHGWHHGHHSGGKLPELRQRLSRHYYDVCQIAGTPTGKEAIADRALLEDVRNHAKVAFNRGWMKIDLAVPGSIHLTPTGELRDRLAKDYEAMRGMIFGDPPTFSEVLDKIAWVEDAINRV